MEIKTVSLVGLGALGILFARLMSAHMAPGTLKIVADRSRVERYERDGVFCNGEHCRFEYISPDEPSAPADLVLVAVKMNDLDDAIEAVRHHVGQGTTILSLLNGITSEERIGRVYGMDKLLLCGAQGMDAGKVAGRLTYHNAGQLSLGDLEPGPASERLKAADRFLTRTGISHEIVGDMKKRLWSKFMINVGANQTTAVYRCCYSGIQADGRYRDIMLAAMREAAALAGREGADLTETDIDYWLGVIDSLNPGGKTSMQQDVEAGRPTDVELFGGTVLALGKKYGLPCPVNRMLYDEIRSVERSTAGEPAGDY
jgi:2-dehydropantoate 2-reductase